MIRQRAFTLIELIVVIVLLGIMAAGAGMLISRPIEAYSDQVRRQQLVDSAEMSLRKITTDIRRALPNSIRITNNQPAGWALEMVNSVDGARYRDEAGGAFVSPAQILDFSAADSDFNLLGRFTILDIASYPSTLPLRAVIYNTSNDTIYSQAALGTSPGVISAAGLTVGIDGNEERVTLATSHQFSFQSPGQRIFLVDGPVSYICDSTTGQLSRYSGYAFQAVHADTDSVSELAALAGAVGGTVATQVSLCNIDYQQGTAQRAGLITLEISLSDAHGEAVSLLQQVHVDNQP
jgi:MSHA biogenesis protein MshO